MARFFIVYVTAKNKNEARTIGRTVVSEKLAACANVFGGMNSFYFWDGDLCDDNEAVVVLKTRNLLLDKLIKRIKALHSYDVPCIVALPISGGNKEYLAWIGKETRKSHRRKRSP
ncbi:MAG: divalent-cation tolerance protein CutA [Chitinispirillaceae bacterium]|nr:divalent-cation tolerance protein CutA [Chitinispirillaceae bacterium]